MNDILDKINTTISDLSTSFGENKKKTDSILMYLIKNINTLDEERKKHEEEISSLKEQIKRLNTTIDSLKVEANNKAEETIKKTNNALNDMNNKIAEVKKSTDEIMSHVLSGDSFVVIDKNDPQFAKWNRMKRFFYLMFHYNKVKRIEKEKAEAEEQERMRKEQEELERKRQLELMEEEKKQEKMNEIKNILNSAKNKNKSNIKS